MKKKEITPEIIDKVKETYKVEKSMRKTRDKLKNLYNLTFHNVRDIINWEFDRQKRKIQKQKEELEKLNNEIQEKKQYDVSDEHYIFYITKEDEYWNKTTKPYPISIKIVDNIFKDFSKHWNNLTSQAILNKYSLKPELWHTLKSRLRLYKDSNVVSPITLQRLNPEEADKKIEDVIDETIQDKYKKSFVDKYNRQKKAMYKKMSTLLSSQEAYMEGLSKYIQDYKPRQLDFEVDKLDNNDEIMVLFSDLHIWKMNTDKVLERLQKMWKDIIKRPERKINLICLGDLFETIVQDWMHPNQKNTMDYTDSYEIVMLVVNILEDLIIKLIQQGKEVNFTGLAWNHDRMTMNKDLDQKRLAWLLTYQLIKRGLKDTETKFNILMQKWNKINMMDYNIILHHWDDWATNKNTSQILWELWDKNKHNLIIFGDKHHLESKDVADNATKIIVPAMAGANTYDKSLLLSSYPGYVMIEKDEDGTPMQLIRRFNF